MARFESIDDYVKAMLDRVSGDKAQKGFLLAVQSTIGAMGKRIFEEGKATSGGRIGRYQTKNKPLYVRDFNSPRKGTKKGKNGNKKFKNGRMHVTTYYNNYSDFRNQMGRRIDTVDLKLSGQLYRNFLNSLEVSNVLGARPVPIPSKATPKKLGTNDWAVVLRPENMAKALGAEERFKIIFSLTNQERIEFRKTAKFEIIKAVT